MIPVIIRVRRGLNGHKYAACNDKGRFICNFDRLADARKHWYIEIHLGYVSIVRELTKYPE